MQRKFYLLLSLIALSVSSALAQGNGGTLKGKVIDKETKKPLPFVNVILFLNGNLITGGQTDPDGQSRSELYLKVLNLVGANY